MSKKKPAPVKAPEPKIETIADKVKKMLELHHATIAAILEDYVADEGLIREVDAAKDELLADVENLDFTQELDIDATAEKLVGMCNAFADNRRIIFKTIRPCIADDSEIVDAVTDMGYICIKVDTLVMKEKLENFITTEMYPYYNDKDMFIFPL